MNPQEQQVIESLFWRVQQGASQAGPRDPEADALIQKKLQSFPQAPYYLAQALIVQERALQQAEQRINQLQQQAGQAPGYQPAPPPYQPQYSPRRGFGGGGFLAGAGQMALGIGGGILVADAATSLASGLFGGGGFGGFGGGDEAAYERGFDAGQQQFDYGQPQQDSGQQQDYGQQQDTTQLDSYTPDQGGGFDGGDGGFDGGDSGGGDGGGGDGGGW